jgi:tetratricopeptide (TPR) repeat protein
MQEDGESGLGSCDNAITSGRYNNDDLALLYVMRGNKYYLKGNYDHALEDFDRAIATDKNYPLAYYARSLLRIDMADYKKALGDISAAIALNSKEDVFLEVRCRLRLYLQQDRIDKDFQHDHIDDAIMDCSRAIQLNPGNVQAFIDRATIHVRNGEDHRPEEYGYALQDLNMAISLDPKNADAFTVRGMVHHHKGDYGNAIQDYSEAIRLEPSNENARNGRCYEKAIVNQLESALADCTEALQLIPNDEHALDSRGFVELKLGRFDAAIDDFDAALRVNPSIYQSLYCRGIAKVHKGDMAGGDSDIKQAKALRFGVEEEFKAYGIEWNQ